MQEVICRQPNKNSSLISIQGPVTAEQASRVCEHVLRALPDWFGLEKSIVEYIESVQTLPTWVATIHGVSAGFLAVKRHFPVSAEIYVMGVLPEYHRMGVGSRLLAAVEPVLRETGVSLLQVKTLAPTHPDLFYARTRAFYAAAGFQPLEIFPDLWDADNPCLLMVKIL